MKIYGNIFNIAFAAISACMAFSCTPKEEVEFVLDGDKIEMGAEGGTVSIKVSSPGSWIARTSEPWVTVSPANGNGTQVCQVIVDSALVLLSEEPSREAVITIQNPDLDNRTISVVQKNYGYSVTLDNDEVSIPDYITLEERHFDVINLSKIPTRPTPKIKDAPLIWRYFVQPLPHKLADSHLDEKEYVARCVGHDNSPWSMKVGFIHKFSFVNVG